MKNLLIILGVALDAALLALSLLLMAGGYRWWGLVALAAGFVLVFAAARFWTRSVWGDSPEPAPAEREWHVWDEELDPDLSEVERDMLAHDCPVDEHAAQMIRALSGQTAVLPEIGLLAPGRPGRHRLDKR